MRLLLQDRGFELHKLGVEVHDEDLCNVDFLEELFIKHKFTHVAHMAAQAGVRSVLRSSAGAGLGRVGWGQDGAAGKGVARMEHCWKFHR